jgi:hypothetical protein
MGIRKPDENVTLRLDPDIVLWARMRALMDGTSMNRVVARLLADYARVPQAWLDGKPPPWEDGRATPPVSGSGCAACAARAARVARGDPDTA